MGNEVKPSLEDLALQAAIFLDLISDEFAAWSRNDAKHMTVTPSPSTPSSSAEEVANELAGVLKWMRDNEPVTVDQIAEVLRNREGVNRVDAIRQSRTAPSSSIHTARKVAEEDRR